ncbi:MAG: DUF2924 domain-containing protein [Ignavibacteriales bacterium]|nr:MAG: DUF2924 domain-containing protein [Ignavibacteriales bacterium]
MKKRNKQKHLVIQHLENISWEVLAQYPDVIKEMIKSKAGVYALYRKQKLYYVGLAANLMGRLMIHLKDRHKGVWDRFSVYLTFHNEHMKELESLMLRISKPPGNKVSGTFISSQSLRSTMHKKIKAENDNKLAQLLGGQFADRLQKMKLKQKKSGSGNLARLFEKRRVIKATHRGKNYLATIRLDGKIGYKGKVYDSVTAVAKVVTGRKSINGWVFWKIKNDKNFWVKMSEWRR